jgi:putative ABC transport system permease protein
MSRPYQIQPPRWPLRLIRHFVKKEFLEEIEGDMEEIFHSNMERMPASKAKRIYAWETIKLLRPVLVRNLDVIERLNRSGMLKNYFKVSYRGLMKNPVNSFINVFGLAAAIGLCVFAFAFGRWTFSTDQFHENKDKVYLTTFFANRDGVDQEYGTTPRPLAEMLRKDLAQIKKVCRVDDRNVVMKHEDNVFHERVRYVDPEFLEMLTFPLKWGTAGSLRDVNSIILSEPMAVKYFGDENPIGQSIQMIYAKDLSKEFKVTGVAAPFPAARTISFNFLINFENFRTSEPSYNFYDWNSFVNATLVQVDLTSDLDGVKSMMKKYVSLQNKVGKEDWPITSFAFQPLATLHVQSEYIKDDISRSSKNNYISIMFMGVIAVLMLALASTNYINIAIATAARRFKEIGVRKSIGATRRVVIFQFLSENIVLTFLALIVGVALGYFFFIPGFERMWNFDMGFRLADATLWIYLPIVLLVTSIASGIYPALYISRFHVVAILRGGVKFGQKNLVTKFFLGFQLIAACIFITMSIMFAQNTDYVSSRGWGYNQDDALYARVPDQSSFEELNAVMSRNPDVLFVSGSAHHVGKSHKTTVVHFPDRDYEVDQLSVDAKYFETLGLELVQGRVFNDFEGSDRQSVVINETFAKSIGDNAVGRGFRIDTVQYEVIGVLKEFHSYSFKQVVRPVIFTVADKANYRFMSLKAHDGREIEVYRALQTNWSTLFPEIPFEGGLQQDVWGFYYEEVANYKVVWRVFAFLVVSLATLGLYGLVRINVEGRTREFSIRKVLGAGLQGISTSVLNRYAVLFIVALVLGAPIGHRLGAWMINFSNRDYHMPTNFSGVSMAVVIMIFVLLATVSTQIWKVLKSNPVDGLKVE